MFGLGGIGLSVIQGAVMAGAERIIGIDTNPRKFALARQLGATDTLNPARRRRRGRDRRADRRRRRLLLRVHRQRRGDGPGAARCAHKGWGQSIIIGVAGAGEEIHARPFLLVTGRTWRGTAFGGVRGRTQLPGFVDRYMAGRIKLDEIGDRHACRSTRSTAPSS